MSELRPIVEHLVDALRKLPDGTWEIDARGTGLMLRKPNDRLCRPVLADIAGIAEVLNAARALVTVDDGSVR